MKINFLFIIGLLLIMPFVFAESETVEVDDIESIEVTTSEVQTSVVDIDSETSTRQKIGNTEVWKGYGWANKDDDGYLVSGFWASQKYSEDGEEKIASFGLLNIDHKRTFRLVKKTDDEIDDSVDFYLVRSGIRDREAAIEDNIGTLSLNKINDYSYLTTWEGTVDIEGGDNQGTWDIEFGTKKHSIKPRALLKAKNAVKSGNIGKKSLFRRIMIWK